MTLGSNGEATSSHVFRESKCSRCAGVLPTAIYISATYIWLGFQLPAFTIQELSWISIAPPQAEGRALGYYYPPAPQKQPSNSD